MQAFLWNVSGFSSLWSSKMSPPVPLPSRWGDGFLVPPTLPSSQNPPGVSLLGDDNVLILDVVKVVHICECTKNH